MLSHSLNSVYPNPNTTAKTVTERRVAATWGQPRPDNIKASISALMAIRISPPVQ